MIQPKFAKLEKSLYPSAVLHFTKKYDLFKKIILSKFFLASYSKEVIVGVDTQRKFGIPMVSFCDIRLSQLNEHMRKYGGYGIGLTKDWAVNNGLNPVSYINSKCSMFSYFDKNLREASEALEKLHDESKAKTSNEFDDYLERKREYLSNKEEYREIINVMRYMKNYEGDLTRKNRVYKNYRFANENEWRYIPDIKSGIIPIKLIKDDKWKSDANERMRKSDDSKLKFDYNDVRYIFVKNEMMASKLINDIRPKLDDDDFFALISKIFISEQLSEDF